MLPSLRVVEEGDRACRGGPWPEGAGGRPCGGKHVSTGHLGGQVAGKCHRFQRGRVSITITSKVTIIFTSVFKMFGGKSVKSADSESWRFYLSFKY